MKKFTIWALAIAVALVSCSKESTLGEGAEMGEKITIGLSDGSVSYSQLASKSIESGDLVAIQIYSVSGSVSTPYANGLFTSFDGLSFDGYSGTTYKVVASLVKSAESVIDCSAGVYAKPFSTSVATEFNYSTTALSDIASSTATLNGVDYAVPTVDRYHAEASKSVSASDATISLFMKRVSFGIKSSLNSSVTEDITIEVAGAPAVTVAVADASEYIIYTHTDLAAAYSADESSEVYSEYLAVKVTSGSSTVYNGTVIFYRNMCATLSCSILSDNSFDVEFETPFESYYTITFEGDEWSALIPATEAYGDESLYGATQYVWSDAVSGLSGSVNEDTWYGGYAFYSGGSSISNYTSSIEGATYNEQLSVEIGGNDGSDNFLVVYSPATLVFAEAKQIEQLYVANTSYMLNTCINGGYGMSEGLADDDWATVTFTGYDASSVETTPVVVFVAQDGVAIEEWTKVDLSPLGSVSSVVVTCYSSNCDDWGYSNVPAYIAIDDITVLL